MLTLEEAIKHCEEVAERLENSCKRDWMGEDDGSCASEHRQLVKWLKELKNFREAIPRIIEASWDHTFEFKGDDEPMTYKICALETVLEILGGAKDDS